MEFIVCKLANNNDALENFINHSPLDFKNTTNFKTYIEIKDAGIYLSKPSINIEKGHIGLNTFIRSKLNLELGSKITIKEIIIGLDSIDELNINISCSSKNIISLHEEVLKDEIRKKFVNNYFSNNQILILSFENKFFILSILCKNKGFMKSNIIINLTSNDPNINIIGFKFLKKELFQDDYNFEDLGIGGLNKEMILIFRRALALRAIKPVTIEKLGIKHVKGMLLYGPPGTGKTLIARKLGNLISSVPPKIVNGPEILNKFIGQSEENLRNLFADAKADYQQNNENANLHIIIFDEIDAICRTRGRSSASSDFGDKLVNQLLSLLDGVDQLDNIFVIAMTNRKELIDEALLRSGRLEIHISIGLPDLEGRKQIFRIHTNKMKINNFMNKNVDIDRLALITENFTGAEIESLIKNACAMSVHESINKNEEDNIKVNGEHFMNAIKESNPMFGTSLKDIFIPDDIYHFEQFEKIKETIKNNDSPLLRILIKGSESSGKTTLLHHLLRESKAKYNKLIRPLDTIAFDENTRSNYFLNILYDSYISPTSIIFIDDLDIQINYVEIGSNINFSNKLFQTILTILKSRPPNKVIFVITINNSINFLTKFFDTVINLEPQKDSIV